VGTDGNSESGRGGMEVISAGSVSTGTNEDEKTTGRVWATGFHGVTARYRLAGVLKLAQYTAHC
jgi:hypothetical protein